MGQPFQFMLYKSDFFLVGAIFFCKKGIRPYIIIYSYTKILYNIYMNTDEKIFEHVWMDFVIVIQ